MTKINGRDDSGFKTQNEFAKLKLNLHKAHTLRILGLLDTEATIEMAKINIIE